LAGELSITLDATFVSVAFPVFAALLFRIDAGSHLLLSIPPRTALEPGLTIGVFTDTGRTAAGDDAGAALFRAVLRRATPRFRTAHPKRASVTRTALLVGTTLAVERCAASVAHLATLTCGEVIARQSVAGTFIGGEITIASLELGAISVITTLSTGETDHRNLISCAAGFPRGTTHIVESATALRPFRTDCFRGAEKVPADADQAR